MSCCFICEIHLFLLLHILILIKFRFIQTAGPLSNHLFLRDTRMYSNYVTMTTANHTTGNLMINGGNTVYGSFSFSKFHLYHDFNYYKSEIERFWYGCRKEIALHFLRYAIGLKNSRQFFIQSEVTLKTNVTRSQEFSRDLRQLHVITTSFDWFIGMPVSFVASLFDTQLKTVL